SDQDLGRVPLNDHDMECVCPVAGGHHPRARYRVNGRTDLDGSVRRDMERDIVGLDECVVAIRIRCEVTSCTAAATALVCLADIETSVSNEDKRDGARDRVDVVCGPKLVESIGDRTQAESVIPHSVQDDNRIGTG